jgi:hypothetical protein
LRKVVIPKCPICSSDLKVAKLYCHHCHTEINGNFDLPDFTHLTPSQLQFIGVFLKNQGSIKGVEKDLNISYPTVKKMLSEILQVLGYEVVVERTADRSEILDKIARGELTADEALEQLKNL